MTAPVTVEWYTPPEIFEALRVRFDLCPASPEPPVSWVPADRFYTVADDGLKQPWVGRVWVNPPYGRGVEQWVERMVAHRNGMILVPVRTDTRWWQQAAHLADVTCFIRGRVSFVPGVPQPKGRRSPTDRPGASNCIFAFGEDNARFLRRSNLGVTMTSTSQTGRDAP